MDGVIKVYDSTNLAWLTLPKAKYSIAPVEVEVQSVMASGKIHVDYIGARIVITGMIDYIEQTKFNRLVAITRSGDFLNTQYVDEDGTTKTGYFKWSQLQAEVFKYKTINNALVPVWVNTPITLTAREVV